MTGAQVVAALYADYGNPKGQMMVNADQLLRRFPTAERTRFGVRIAPKDVPALMAELEAKFGLGSDSVADQATTKREARRVFNRTFAITAALNAFTLGVAGIALLTSLLTLGQARLPQLAPLWAIGLTRRRIAMLELAKTMALALLTALAGAAARYPRGVVPDRGRQCAGLWLAAAAAYISGAARSTAPCGDARRLSCNAASNDQAGTHAPDHASEDFRR